MIDPTTLLAFSIAALLLLLIPGPGILYLLARSISQGRKAGFISSLGLSTGSLVHVIFTTLGISALLATSAAAFNLLKLIGSVYLIYLGIQTILSKTPDEGVAAIKPVPFLRLFIDGVMVSVFNPKIAIFFIAFLPQFYKSLVSGLETSSVPRYLTGSVYIGLGLGTALIDPPAQ